MPWFLADALGDRSFGVPSRLEQGVHETEVAGEATELDDACVPTRKHTTVSSR